jgi:hypothetical protein
MSGAWSTAGAQGPQSKERGPILALRVRGRSPTDATDIVRARYSPKSRSASSPKVTVLAFGLFGAQSVFESEATERPDDGHSSGSQKGEVAKSCPKRPLACKATYSPPPLVRCAAEPPGPVWPTLAAVLGRDPIIPAAALAQPGASVTAAKPPALSAF